MWPFRSFAGENGISQGPLVPCREWMAGKRGCRRSVGEIREVCCGVPCRHWRGFYAPREKEKKEEPRRGHLCFGNLGPHLAEVLAACATGQPSHLTQVRCSLWLWRFTPLLAHHHFMHRMSVHWFIMELLIEHGWGGVTESITGDPKTAILESLHPAWMTVWR